MPYFADLRRGETWGSGRLAYTQTGNNPYTGKNYEEHALGNLSIFDGAKSVSKQVFLDKSIHGDYDYDFSKQYSKWEELNKSISRTRNGDGLETRLIAFDFETIGMRNVHTYDGNITELGITETLLKKRSNKVVNSYSIAFGIDENQFTTLAKQLHTVFKGGGINALGLDYEGIKGLESDMERLSRYSGAFEDVFQMSSISGISRRKLVTIKQLSESNGLNQKAISEGLVNLAILGGITPETYEKVLSDAEFKIIDVESYKRKQKEFLDKGFRVQTIKSEKPSKDVDALKSRIANFFTEASKDKNTFFLGFNTSAYDIPIYRAAFANANGSTSALRNENVLDLLSGIKFATRKKELNLAKEIASNNGLTHTGISKRTTLEGIAKAFGITMNAHNAASDTEVTNELIALSDFHNGQSFTEMMVDAVGRRVAEPNGHNAKEILKRNVYYALESIGIDKNGADYFSSGGIHTKLHNYGIQRGRYYRINEIKEYDDGRIGVEFLTASEKSVQDRFIKVFNSFEEAQKTISNTFIADAIDTTKGSNLDYLEINEQIVNADRARRNYEDLFSVQSLQYDTNSHTYIGGYDRLNQYYKAYKNTVSVFISDNIEINDNTIDDIAEGKYDSKIAPILGKSLGLEEDKGIAPSMLRDFKNIFGKIRDEAEMLEYIENEIGNENLSNHQKTLIAGNIRGKLIDFLERWHTEYSSEFTGYYDRAARRDLFNIGMKFGVDKDITYINFEHKEHAVQSILRQTKANNPVDGIESLYTAINDLYAREVINPHYSIDSLVDLNVAAGVKSFSFNNLIKNMLIAVDSARWEGIHEKLSHFSVSTIDEVQKRLLVESFVTHIQDTYINPIKKKIDYRDFIHSYSISDLGFDENKTRYLHNFMLNKTAGKVTGELSLLKARNSKYVSHLGDTDTIYTVGEMFERMQSYEDFNDSVQRIISNGRNMEITMDEGEINRILIEDLGYTEAAAETTHRTLFQSKTKSGEEFGLTQITTDNKPRFITQFAYSGKKGEDAFILTNFNTDNDSRNLAKTMEIMASDKSFQEKIKDIQENNYSAVFRLPAIHRDEIAPDTSFYDSGIMQYIDIDGNPANYSFNTIGMGDKGFQKVSQFSLGNYYIGDNADPNLKNLENLDIYLTDSASDLASVWRQIRQGIINITTDPSNIKETYASMSRLYSHKLNSILTDAPGPVGYQALYTKDGWKKVLAPTVSDTFLSSQISIQPLEILTLEAAKMDFLDTKKNLSVAGTISKNDRLEAVKALASLSGRQNDDIVVALDSMLERVRDGKSVNLSFDEFFSRHLFNMPMNSEKGAFANKANFTIFDYLQDVAERYNLPEHTLQTLNFIGNNRDKISQLIKEKAVYDKKRIGIYNPFMSNFLGSIDTNIRPTGNQVANAQHYKLADATTEMGKEAVEKLEMRFGYDIMPIQEYQRRTALAGRDVYEGIKYGELETGVTLNVKQMSPTELLSKIHHVQNNFDDIFEELYTNTLKSGNYGFRGIQDESVSKQLIQEVLNITKTKANTYESKAFGRDSLLNLSLFNSPNVVTARINTLDKEELESLYDNYPQLKYFDGTLENGTSFVVINKNNVIRTITYNGPSGTIDPREFENFLTTGKVHLIENTQGTDSVKLFMYNEKMTLTLPEFDTSDTFDRFRRLFNGNADEARKAYSLISDAIYDEILGKNVSIATDLPMIKHGTGSIIYGNYLSRIFNPIQNELSSLSMGKRKELAGQIIRMFEKADPNGLKIIHNSDFSKLYYDESFLKEGGVRTQIMGVVDEIAKRAEKSGPYQSLWGNITNDISESVRNGIARVTVTRGVNNESMGEEMNIDPRIELSTNLKFLEDMDGYNADLNDFENLNAIKVDDGYVTTETYISKRILEEATDKSTLIGKKYRSAKKTLEGIAASAMHFGSPEKMANSNIILDLKLDQINLVPTGSDAEELMKVGIFKTIDSKHGAKYSDQLKALARQQGKNIEDISVLRLALPDGISFSNFSDKKNGKVVSKNVNQLLIPLYDITPFEGEAQYTKTPRIINDVINELKTYGKNKNIQQSKESLQKKIRQMYDSFAEDYNTNDKKSFAYQRTLKLPMKNSIYVHAESSVMPVVTGMRDNSLWTNAGKAGKDYRNALLTEIKTGEIGHIDLAESGYTTKIGKKLYYDDVIELSESGLEKLGINFQSTGKDIFFHGKNYRPLINGIEHGFDFDKDYAKAIIESNDIEHYKKALTDEKLFNRLEKMLNSRKFKDEDFIELFKDLTGMEIEDLDIPDILHELQIESGKINNSFSVLAKNYLSTTGTFAKVGRFPTFHEGSTNDVILRYNKNLKKDDIRVTPALMERMAGDFDGDSLIVKAFLKNGVIVNRTDKKLYASLSKGYANMVFKEYTDTNGTVYASKTNKEMHDLIKGIAEKMEKRGVVEGTEVLRTADAIGETLQYKSVMIDDFLSKENRNTLLTEIGLEEFIDYEVSDMDDETIGKIYNAWENKYGNMYKYKDHLDVADKARVAKPDIGTVSNTSYRFNKSLENSINYALQKGDTELLSELREIKQTMHVNKSGFIPETEQSFISVKHVKSVEDTYRANLYTSGMNDIFKGKKYAAKGANQIREAVGHINYSGKLDEYIDVLNRAANIPIFKKFWDTLSLKSTEDSVSFFEDAFSKSSILNEEGIVTKSAIRINNEALADLDLAFNMGYYHDNILQELKRDNVYIVDEGGEAILYRQTNDLRRYNDGSYGVSFETFNLSNGKIKDNTPVWDGKYTLKAKSNAQLQSMLQEKFGDYEALNVASMSNMKKFKETVTNKIITKRTSNFANKYIRGSEPYDYAEDVSKLGKDTAKNIKRYRDVMSEIDIEDFINQMEFIRDNIAYQSSTGRELFKSRTYINDMLTEINKEIIEKGKNRTTSTSVSNIFSERIKQVANANGISRLEGINDEYKNYLANKKTLDSSMFDGYDERIIDLRKAEYDLEDSDNIEEALKSYRYENDTYIKSLQRGMKFTTTSDIDRVFGWDGSGDMRVGFNTRNSLFGRSFSDLSDEDIEEIMNFIAPEDADEFDRYSIEQTKSKLREYLKDYSPNNNNGLQGAKEKDIMNLTKEINDKIIEEGSKTTEEGLNAKGKKEATKKASGLLNKTLGDAKNFAKDFIKTTPGKVMMGLAALGLVNEMLTDNSSPLAPELNQKNATGPTNNDTLRAPASKANTGKKVLYSDPTSGTQFKMSAKSKDLINQMNVARQLSSQTGGDTNINIQDDRSQVSNNWLERKFSELV